MKSVCSVTPATNQEDCVAHIELRHSHAQKFDHVQSPKRAVHVDHQASTAMLYVEPPNICHLTCGGGRTARVTFPSPSAFGSGICFGLPEVLPDYRTYFSGDAVFWRNSDASGTAEAAESARYARMPLHPGSVRTRVLSRVRIGIESVLKIAPHGDPPRNSPNWPLHSVMAKVLIIGGNRGIGLALAQELVRADITCFSRIDQADGKQDRT